MTLVPLDPSRCPDCQARLCSGGWEQPALARHAGYGGTARTTVRWCPACHWLLETSVETIR